MSAAPATLCWRTPERLWGLLGVGAGVLAPSAIAVLIAPSTFPSLMLAATPVAIVCGLLLMGWMLRHTDGKGRFGKTRMWVIGRALLIGLGVCAILAAVLAVTFASQPGFYFFLIAASVTLPGALVGGVALAFIALRPGP